VAIALIGAALLSTSGALGLMEPTETRYAEIAREMLASGDWIAPRLDGIHHFHKPPLAYWAAAWGMAIAGVNAWGARLAVGLAAIVTLAGTAWAARGRLAALGAGTGRAAWVLGSMGLFAVVGRALSTDPFLAAAVALYWAFAGTTWALVALAVGFMAKGPVVFVHTALPVLITAAWARDRRVLRWLGPARGWWWFALIALPWYLIVVATHRGLLGYFLGNQLWERYATTIHRRAEPPWYFLAILIAGAIPWTPAMIVGLVRTWRARARIEARLVIAWLLTPVVFLSFSGSKLPAYLLPCLPAGALLAVRGLDARSARWGAALLLAGMSIYGLAAGGVDLVERSGYTQGSAVLPPLAIAACALVGLAAVAAARGRVGATGLLMTLALATLAVALEPYESVLGSPRRIAALLAEQRRGNEPVVEIGDFNAGIPFYLERTVPLLEVPREPGFEDPRSLAAAVVPRDSIAAWTIRYGRVWTFGPADRVRSVASDLGLDYVGTARWRGESLGFVATPR
jgi:4-amino-4-deoxy-L-arabinose transferase-like glycosyltransferase